MNGNLHHLLVKRLTRSRLLLLGLVLGIASFTPFLNLQAATTFTGCGGEYVTATNAQAEAQVVELVNIERAKVGLPPYKAIAELTEAARYHAADMAADRYQDHYTKDRDANDALVTVCTWTTRVRKYYPDFDTLIENVGNGTSSPQAIMDAWMASSGHKAAILGNYREIGVGYFNKYWTQDFTTRNGVSLLIINREARQTTTATVALYVYGGWAEMRLRNDSGAWSEWQPFQNEFDWTLTNEAGLRLVEMEMRSGQTTVSSSDTIELALGNATTTPTRTPTATHTPTIKPTATATVNPTSTTIATVAATATTAAIHTPTATATALSNVATSTATATTIPATTTTPTPIATLIDPTVGGNLTYSDQDDNGFTFTIPGGAVESATELHLQPGGEPLLPNSFAFTSQSFTLDAVVDGVVMDGFVFAQPITVRIDYTEERIRGIDEGSLLLYFYDEVAQQWVDAATTCTPPSGYERQPKENAFVIKICHLTEFALFGRQLPKLYLPLIRR